MQTKVRQIIAELIEPIEQKILSTTLALHKLHTHADNQQQKLESLTLMVNNDPSIFEHGIFARIEGRIDEAKMHSKEL